MVVAGATAIAYQTKFNDPAHPCLDGEADCLLLSSLERGLMMAVSIIPHGFQRTREASKWFPVYTAALEQSVDSYINAAMLEAGLPSNLS